MWKYFFLQALWPHRKKTFPMVQLIRNIWIEVYLNNLEFKIWATWNWESFNLRMPLPFLHDPFFVEPARLIFTPPINFLNIQFSTHSLSTPFSFCRKIVHICSLLSYFIRSHLYWNNPSRFLCVLLELVLL